MARFAVYATCLGAALLAPVGCASHASMTVVGTLSYSANWFHTGARTRTEDWLVYAFDARASEEVEVYVRSSAGAPAARLLDGTQRTLADGAISHPDGDTMARATFRAPSTGTYYLCVRDDAARDAALDIQLFARSAIR